MKYTVGTILRHKADSNKKSRAEIIGLDPVVGGKMYQMRWFRINDPLYDFRNKWSEGGINRRLEVVSVTTHFEEELFTL